MAKRRVETLLTLAVVGAGLLIAAIAGLFGYMSLTAIPLHPNAESVPHAAQSAPSPRWAGAVEQGRQILRAGLAEGNLPGLSVAVGIDGDIVWAEAFGFADLEKRLPLTPNLRFRIGTASTALTSAAAGLLLEKNQLKLDEEIQTYVPEFPDKQWPVTLRQVMGHVGGIWNDGGDEAPLLSVHCDRTADAVRAVAKHPLVFQPGTDYRFSRYGWILVSRAIEAAANEPFLTFMQEQVFEPLKMADTRAESATEEIPNRPTFYFPRFAANPRYGPDVIRPLDYSCYAGSSVFLSTPSDLVRFGMAVTSGTLLRPATVDLLQTSQRLASGKETGYGLGWDLETVTLAGQPTPVVGHDGDVLGGIAASLMTFRQRGLVVAVVSNISYADTFSLGVKLAEAFARQEHAPQ